MRQNKVSTLGYFTKRLKDNGFIVWKIFNKYSDDDVRKWTVLVNPSDESIFITCIMNIDGPNSLPAFEFNDGQKSIHRHNIMLQTESMEVLMNHLIKQGVENNSETNSRAELFAKESINNYDE